MRLNNSRRIKYKNLSVSRANQGLFFKIGALKLRSIRLMLLLDPGG